MTQSALYALDHLVLKLEAPEPIREDLHCLLHDLSWVTIRNYVATPTVCISIKTNAGFQIPQNCRETLRTDEFCGFELDDNFYLTDGSSVFHFRPQLGEAYASITTTFFSKPEMAQTNFWCFGLLKLLRPLGFYSLHAAGLATQDREGVLLVGPPGSGKSTLAIGLIRAGWNYLSDDAVLLRPGSEGVEALAGRRSFYIDAARSMNYPDVCLGDEEPDSSGGVRRRLGIDESYSEQYLPRCLPRVVIFPQIKCHNQSTLTSIDKISALRFLLTQSAPQLFDRITMSAHLELLKRLLQQTKILPAIRWD